MLNIRNTMLLGLALVAIATPQEKSSAGVVTVYDHAKLDASFNKAFAEGGSNLLWSHTSSKGTYNVDTHSRDSVKAACKRGAATMVVGGTAKNTAPDKFGGQSIQGGGSHRISKGDVFIMPPDTVHWYKNVEAPFRYIEVPVP